MDTRNTTAAKAKHELTDSLHHMLDEADQFLKSAALNGDRQLDAARDKLAEQMVQMRSQLEDLEDSAASQARHAARVAQRTLREHPFGALGIAAVAGLLVGVLLTRR